MKAIKKITAVLAIAITILLLSSYGKNKENNEDRYFVKLDDGRTMIYGKSANEIASFNTWTTFNTANAELLAIEKMDDDIYKEHLEDLNGTIKSLPKTIPTWLKTEEVMEDIIDVQKECTKLMKKKNEPVKENLEELSEKFDDLREELGQVIEDYETE